MRKSDFYTYIYTCFYTKCRDLFFKPCKMKKLLNLIILIYLFTLSFKPLCQTLVEDFELPTPITRAYIDLIKINSENKILISGSIDFFNDIEKPKTIKLNTDGSLDQGFNLSSNISFKNIEFLSNGDIIGVTNDSLYKLSSTGLTSKSIKIEHSSSIALKHDNIFIVSAESGLKKYNSNLELDTSFKNDNVFDATFMYTIALQGDYILVAGNFTTINGISQNDIARFDSDGFFDSSFNTGTGTSDAIFSLVVQNDEKIILGKAFINSFNGTSFNGLVRLNVNGSIDTSFSPPKLNGATQNVVLQNNKIIISAFYDDGTTTEHRLIRLNTDGTIDNTFSIINSKIYEIALTDNGSILTDSNDSEFGLNKYSLDGIIDNSFNPPITSIGYFNDAAYYDGFIIISGDFFKLNNIKTFQLGKIDLEGKIDTYFIVEENEINTQFPVEIKIKNLNEIYTSYGNKLIRLNENGNIDTSFQTPEYVVNPKGINDPYFAHQFEFLENNKIVIAGPNGVYLLNADGSHNTTFSLKRDYSSTAFTIELQSTNNIIYGSFFTQINDINTNKIVRLNYDDGSIENTFNIGDGPTTIPFMTGIHYTKVLPNDEILISFRGQYNGLTSNLNLYKLGVNGALDTDFISNINSTYDLEDNFSIGGSPHGINYMDDSFIFPFYDFSKSMLSLGKLNFDGTTVSDFSLENQININRFYGRKIAHIDQRMFLILGDLEITNSGDFKKGALFVDDNCPVITGTTSNLQTTKETPLPITVNDVTIEDPDNTSGDFTIKVLDGDNYSILNNTITPDNDFIGSLKVSLVVNDGEGISQVFKIDVQVNELLSTKEKHNNHFSIFPNPTSGIIRIKSNIYNKVTNIKIYSLNGHLLLSKFHQETQMNTIDLGNLQKGIYFLHISNNAHKEVFKIIKN